VLFTPGGGGCARAGPSRTFSALRGAHVPLGHLCARRLGQTRGEEGKWLWQKSGARFSPHFSLPPSPPRPPHLPPTCRSSKPAQTLLPPLQSLRRRRASTPSPPSTQEARLKGRPRRSPSPPRAAPQHSLGLPRLRSRAQPSSVTGWGSSTAASSGWRQGAWGAARERAVSQFPSASRLSRHPSRSPSAAAAHSLLLQLLLPLHGLQYHAGARDDPPHGPRPRLHHPRCALRSLHGCVPSLPPLPFPPLPPAVPHLTPSFPPPLLLQPPPSSRPSSST
jgi:hypothetical protein